MQWSLSSIFVAVGMLFSTGGLSYFAVVASGSEGYGLVSVFLLNPQDVYLTSRYCWPPDRSYTLALTYILSAAAFSLRWTQYVFVSLAITAVASKLQWPSTRVHIRYVLSYPSSPSIEQPRRSSSYTQCFTNHHFLRCCYHLCSSPYYLQVG